MTLAELRFLEEQFYSKEEKQLSKHKKTADQRSKTDQIIIIIKD